MKRLIALVLGVLALLGLRRLWTVPGIVDPEGPDVVLADDGVPLWVQVDEAPGAELTVVLVHGFTARHEEFALQRRTLLGRARVVLYDQRGHGASGWGDPRHADLDQLGRDLGAVLERHAPTGPVVLLGHSMGGMTVMALARQRPELFGTRVVGVFLLATSAGEVASDGTLGRVVGLGTRYHVVGIWLRLLQSAAPALQRLRKPGTRVGYAFTRHYLFGTDDADPETVRVVQDLLEMAPFSVSAAFYPLFVGLDELGSLAAMREVPVTVLVGDSDRLTPKVHSERIVAVIGPTAELVVVPGAGHTVNITRQQVVDDAILALLDRARIRAVA